MIAVKLDVLEREIVAKGQAFLLGSLEIASRANLDHVGVVQAEATTKVGAKREFGFQIVDGKFIEKAVALDLMANLTSVDVILDAGRLGHSRLSAKVANVGFLPNAPRHLERLAIIDLPIDFGKAEMLAERALERARKILRIERQGFAGWDGAGRHRRRAVLDIGFIVDEEEQLVLDDRTAQRRTILVTLEVDLPAIALLQEIAADHLVVLVGSEHFAVKLVGSRLGNRGDDCGARILIFGLEVGREDAEFLHRQLREGIAAADILPDDPALLEIGLQADPVDEHVDLWPAERIAVAIGPDSAPGKGLAKVGLVDLYPRRQSGEIEEVAIVLRQVFDLLPADIGRDLGGLGLGQPSTDDDDFAPGARGRSGSGHRRRRHGRVEVKRRGLTDPDDHALLARGRGLGCADADVVGSRTKPGQHIATIGPGGGASDGVGFNVDRRYHRPRRRFRAIRDDAVDGRGGQLRRRRRGERDVQGQRRRAEQDGADQCGSIGKGHDRLPVESDCEIGAGPRSATR